MVPESKEPSDAASARIEIGYVLRAHGIRGEVVVITHDPESTAPGDVAALWIDGAPRAIEDARETPKGWLVQLAGIVDRDAAEALKGKAVEVARAELGLEDDDVLLADLVGCAVVLKDGGGAWGTIVGVELGMQDRLVIHDGDVERLLPVVDEFVLDIDLEAKVVTVDPPEGLPSSPVIARRGPRGKAS